MQASYNDSSAEKTVKSDRARLHQVDELAAFVHSKISNSPYPCLIAGNVLDTVVDGTGDFNVHARPFGTNALDTRESDEYKYFIRKLNRDNESCTAQHLPVRDLLKEHSGGLHPTTYGDICPKTGAPREVALTDPVDHCSQLCIDHALFIDTVENHTKGAIQVEEGSTQVEEFFVPRDKFPFTQLSDHYGLTTVLVVHPSTRD